MNTEIVNTLFKMAQSIDYMKNGRVAAAVVYKNKVVSFGHSHLKSHPFQKTYSKNRHSVFFHAETHAIKNSLRIIDVDTLKKCDLYVVRAKINPPPKRKKWTFGLSKPCSGCQKCIDNFELKNVYYSDDSFVMKKTNSDFVYNLKGNLQ